MIFFECFSDEILLKSLGFTSKKLRGGHSYGRSKVIQRFEDSKSSLALIDEDPGSPRDHILNRWLKLSYDHKDDYVICVKDSSKKLILVRPNLEQFTIHIANDRGVDLKERYGLSMEERELHEILSTKRKEQKRKGLKLFYEDSKNHKVFKVLREFVKDKL